MEETKKNVNMTLDDMIKNDKTCKYRRFRSKNRRRTFRSKNKTSETKADNRRRIRVENLNKDMQNADLTKLFEPYGKLTRCGIHFDKLGNSTGFADVEFSTHDECEEAIQKLDNATINNVTVRVKYASFLRKRFRKTRSIGTQRRKFRRENRLASRRPRTAGGRLRTGRPITGLTLRKNRLSSGRRRRVFTRTLGRRRQQMK